MTNCPQSKQRDSNPKKKARALYERHVNGVCVGVSALQPDRWCNSGTSTMLAHGRAIIAYGDGRPRSKVCVTETHDHMNNMTCRKERSTVVTSWQRNTPWVKIGSKQGINIKTK